MKSKPGNFNHGNQKPTVKINFKNKFVFTSESKVGSFIKIINVSFNDNSFVKC